MVSLLGFSLKDEDVIYINQSCKVSHRVQMIETPKGFDVSLESLFFFFLNCIDVEYMSSICAKTDLSILMLVMV